MYIQIKITTHYFSAHPHITLPEQIPIKLTYTGFQVYIHVFQEFHDFLWAM